MQNTNKELENYVATLEKLSGIQVEYKGKPVYCCQNKGITLKHFKSRAEIALWLSKSFGLNIESILVRESDTGVKHTINMQSNLPSDLLSAPKSRKKP